MSFELPKSKRKRFRLIYRGIFLLIGFLAVYIMSILIQEQSYKLSLIPAFFVLLTTMFEFVLGEVVAESRYPSKTEKIMTAIESKLPGILPNLNERLLTIINSLSGCDKTLIKATIHLKVEIFSNDGETLENCLLQILPYISAGMPIEALVNTNNKQWRTTLSYKGIIGRCLRTLRPEYVNFSTHEEYNFRMVREFGFSKEESEKITFSARSYCAFPIFSDKEVIGIVYLYTAEPQAFPRAIDINIFNREVKYISDILKIGKII